MSGYSTLVQAGDFRVEECVLQSSSGTVHDEFQKQIQGIQITESLFTNSLTGALLVTDNNNLPMNMPITVSQLLIFLWIRFFQAIEK